MGLLRRLGGGAPGLTRDQEALLARHEERGAPLLEPLVLGRADPAALEPDQLVSVVVTSAAGIRPLAGLEPWEWWWRTREVVTKLARRRLPWTLDDVELMFALARREAARPENSSGSCSRSSGRRSPRPTGSPGTTRSIRFARHSSRCWPRSSG